MSWSLQEVSKHNNSKSCWVIINKRVYDVTDFLQEHPGGSRIILKYAGRDATSAYEPIHPSDALDKNLSPSQHLGPLDDTAVESLERAGALTKKTQDELRVEEAMKKRPPLNRILSLADMEDVAKQVLSYRAWAYYSSAADDEISLQENARAFQRFFFKARVMRPVSHCDSSTRILGFETTLPIFVCGSALAKLGHPLGEINITKGCAPPKIIQMVSSNASLSYAEIAAASTPSQTLFFQLYKHKDDAIALKRIREIEQLGYKAIFLTVDAVVPSNRERDVRSPWVLDDQETGIKVYNEGEGAADTTDAVLGVAGALIVNDDRDMTWEKTIPWLRSVTKLPIVIKGIQCVQDAILAAEAKVDGILLSNHGGRQLEYSLPPLEVLYRLRTQQPQIFDKMEVYLDGGVRRGTDVVKALCLGAKAVGLGRPFLYAQSAYGEVGVRKIISILEREIVTTMRLMGVSNIGELTPDMVERVDWQPVARIAKL
ncbi:FMN-dependent dehydrogenase-domain-containing protein [Lentinula raphanica]|uniref:L-lactate dehydrogenase (cytochrome) n=1 Tax=Lentinula raphanica TaxID=153919 RepID=A0AA38PBE3_9AGAR|nr:FMN-dependent dehydrogenase-domain-containing protein [Lentinula raphanica]KAJ3778045.1 FMN-dependent dehydrogenase-domain-containing protein [Lentinula raphanica]KAJ3839813.1 FMN-dependent dehydrogenase-domain-containing protein [Lentinula raphanica]KAJ3976317.1 FMN-dependent dehydrogenase-domain-containing protein [Lentinula raphanica]